MTPGQIVLAIRAAIVVAALLLIWAFWHGLVGYIVAPFERENAAIKGDNATFVEAAKAGNEQVDADKKSSDARKAKRDAAVAGAGKAPEARAKAILEKPAAGSTPLERAHRRIDEELGL